MAVKIRLQRHGKKGKPFYWIVAADARSKRDGKYLEKLGSYNPNTNPATIDLNVDGAVTWLQHGAQPTDTARAILSYKGALLKKHLAVGVKKGALTEEEAEAKFKAWLEEKEGKINAKREGLAKAEAKAKAKVLEAEKAISDARVALAEEEAVAEEAPTDEAIAEETTEATATETVEAEGEKKTVKEEPTKEVAEVEEKKEPAKEEPAENATQEAVPEETTEKTAKETTEKAKAVEASAKEATTEKPTEENVEEEPVAKKTKEDTPPAKEKASKEEE